MSNNYDSTINKFNELLQKSQKAMVCGPDCQKAEASKTLEQKYLDAQVNLQTAPIQLQEAAKKYYTYTQGQSGYDNYINNDLQTKLNAIVSTLTKSFTNNLNTSKTLTDTYNTQLINSQYAKQVYDKYLEENTSLENKLKDNSYDIFTNDRKTYYEDQGIDNLKWWYTLFYRLYFILVFAYILFCFISTSNFNIVTRIIILIFLIIYLFIAPYILLYILHFCKNLYTLLPKNAYLHL
jgi:hypothetical protein